MSERRSIAIAAALALTAGFADGTGYLRWHLFAANMTGNTVLLGIAAFHTDLTTIGRILAPIGGFLVGCALAALVRDRLGPRGALALECAALGVAALIERTPMELVVIALAMGVQNTALGTFGTVEANTSFITGDLAKVAVAVVHTLQGRLGPAERSTIALMAAIVGCYATGAAIAAALAAQPLRHLLLCIVPVAAAALAVPGSPARMATSGRASPSHSKNPN